MSKKYRFENYLSIRILETLFPLKRKKAIQPETIKSIGIVFPDSKKMGDALYLTKFLAAMNVYRPDIHVTVLTQKTHSHLLNGFENTSFAHIFEPMNAKGYVNQSGDKKAKGLKNKILSYVNTYQKIKKLKKQFDLVITYQSSFQNYDFFVLYSLKATHNIGYCRFPTKHTFSINLYEENNHMNDRINTAISAVLEKPLDNYPLGIPSFQEALANIRPYIQSASNPIIAMNFLTSVHTQLGDKVIPEIVEFIQKWLNAFPSHTLFLIPVPQFEQIFKQVVDTINQPFRIIYKEEPACVKKTLAIISLSDFVFSPDTSVVHMANALDKPVVGIYPHDIYNLHNWGPLNKHSATIFYNTNTRKSLLNFDWNELKKAIKTVEKNCLTEPTRINEPA